MLSKLGSQAGSAQAVQSIRDMDLLALVILLIIIGAALYIVPMEPKIKNAIVVLVLVVVALLILRAYLPPIQIGR